MDSDDDVEVTDDHRQWFQEAEWQEGTDRRIIREKYRELIDSAQKEKESGVFDANNVIQNMGEADKLFKDVRRSREAVYDARLLNIHGELAKKKAHDIQAGRPFSSAIFLRKLAVELTGRRSDSDVKLEREAWLKLGNRVYKLFNRTPKLNFIQGTFLEPAETVRQQRRAKVKDTKTKTSQPKVVDSDSQKASTDKTFEEIQRIKKILLNLHRKKGEPICYFHFTIDPDSFSRTIENMFHLAFLIKEREVYLSLDSNKLPVIEPVTSGVASAHPESSQSVLTMSVAKWKQLVEVFEIKESVIPPSKSYST